MAFGPLSTWSSMGPRGGPRLSESSGGPRLCRSALQQGTSMQRTTTWTTSWTRARTPPPPRRCWQNKKHSNPSHACNLSASTVMGTHGAAIFNTPSHSPCTSATEASICMADGASYGGCAMMSRCWAASPVLGSAGTSSAKPAGRLDSASAKPKRCAAGVQHLD